MSVTTETPNDKNDEYIGPRLHFNVPPQDAQPNVQNLNQGIQIPSSYPKKYFVVTPSLVYPGAPYAPYKGHYGEIVGEIFNLRLMYPRGYPQSASSLVLSQATSQGVQLPNHPTNL